MISIDSNPHQISKDLALQVYIPSPNEDIQKQILRKFGESKVTLVNLYLYFNKNPAP